VLLAGQAQALEDDAPDKALDLALEAHGLARDLVPAAATAGRILAARGRTPKAARVLLRTWRQSPHPDLAVAYAYDRPGDSPRDRLDRVRHLPRLTPNHPEALIALATSAIEARAWDEAREALKPLIEGRLTQRVCALMARIEGEQYRDAGRVREWLARAAAAAPDPAWVVDGVAYPRWSPASPLTGQLDAMRWTVPETSAGEGAAALATRLEALLGLGGTAGEVRIEAATPDAAAAARPGHAEPGAGAAAGQTRAQIPAGPAPSPPAPAVPIQGEMPGDADATAGGGAAPVPAVEPGTPARPRPRKPVEPRIFVPPRAPDDPGADASDLDDLQGYPSKA
jgi:HemY protein